MKLLFSEAHPEYADYVFPYAVWAFPTDGETPAEMMARGFLPASRDLDRYYMCRHLRIDLSRFKASSENRRILRKGQGIDFELVPKKDFRFTKQRREFFKTYADIKFGRDVMSYDRLDSLMEGRAVTHLLVFKDAETGGEVGYVMFHVQVGAMAHYSFSFYDLNYYQRSLGLYMMTSAVKLAADSEIPFLYLGTVYSGNALYKTQFRGVEFFNGFEWTPDMAQLRHLLERNASRKDHHLLENEEFRRLFYDGTIGSLAGLSAFHAPPAGG